MARPLWSCCLAVCLLTGSSRGLASADQSGEGLQPGAATTRNLDKSGAAQVAFHAAKGDFVHLEVKTGARLAAGTVVDAAEQNVTSYPRILTGRGAQITLSAPATGRFLLRLRSEGTTASGAEATVRLVARRAPTAEDGLRLDAARLLNEAQQRAGTSGESRRAALELLKQSARASEQANDVLAHADTLNRIGQTHYGLNEFRAACEAQELAAAHFDKIGDLRGKAEALGNAGTAYRQTGNIAKARELQETTLGLLRQLGDRRGESYSLHNLGAIEFSLGRFSEAIAYYEQSLAIKRELGDIAAMGATFSNMATTYARLGMPELSLESYRRALEVRRKSGDERGSANDLMGLGIQLAGAGQLDEGLQHTRDALAIFRKYSDQRGEGHVLHNMASLYENARDYTTALQLYEQALPLRRTVGDPATIGTTLMKIGSVHLRLGDAVKAQAPLEEALALKKKTGDRYGEAYVAGQLAVLHQTQGQRARAIEFARQSLDLSRAVKDPTGEATSLHQLGVILGNADAPAALESLQASLQIRQRLRARTAEAGTRYSIARLQRELGRLDEARATLVPAIAAIESVRGGVIHPDLRTAFLSGHHQFYELMVDVLMRQHQREPAAGHDRAALEFSDRARARQLIDTLAAGRVDVRRGSDPTLASGEQKLRREIESTQSSIVRLVNEGNETGLAAAEDRLRGQLRELEDLRAEIRRRSPAYAALQFPEPVPVQRLQSELLDKDTALLEFMVGKESAFLWVVTSNAVRSFALPPSADLGRMATSLRRAVTARQQPVAGESATALRARIARADRDQAAAARALSTALFRGVELPATVKRLVIAADGPLQTLPFAALPDPSRRGTPLIARYELAQIPSLSALAAIRSVTSRTAPSTATVAVVADPVFNPDDPRIGKAATFSAPAAGDSGPESAVRGALSTYGRLERLRFSRGEAETIASLVPGRGVTALDFDASRQRLATEPFRRASVLHFATHALLHPADPRLSGIVLSLVTPEGGPSDGFLRLHDIYNLDLEADLVVLSACETALGAELRGEGLQAMSRGFMYAGARRVVATLWQVDDRATSMMMRQFYTALLQKRMTPAAALRSAMDAMSRHPRWSAPYYWAGFVLQGDW